MKTNYLFLCFVLLFSQTVDGESIRKIGVESSNTAQVNKALLQRAIDSLSAFGGSIYVDPTSEPYPMAGGIVLRKNVSIIGANAATPRGTSHPTKPQPVGSVFRITDTLNVFITVESATQISGIQFWYSDQATKDPANIIQYPATIRLSYDQPTEGVTLNNLTFYGEYFAMDFAAPKGRACELITIEHCYGYSLGGTFIRIDFCYDIPRILHCHMNPAINRQFAGGFSPGIIDAVIARKTYAYVLDHTDNAQLIDVFTFGSYGGISLGPETYGQLTNFNLDCVAIGIHKSGNNSFNRNWQIAQGAIIANTGEPVENIHPIWIEGSGHTAITNVESFSGQNGALTTLGASYDFLKVTGTEKCTVSLFGCRMRNYVTDHPFTIENKNAVVQAVACVDKNEDAFGK